jgi:hypothetical protein
MAKIIQFPRGSGLLAQHAELPLSASKPVGEFHGETIFSRLLTVAWVAVTLMWPVLKWILSINVVFQFFRMIYHWGTPDMHAAWTLLLHFAALTSLTCFVSLYKPKGKKF